MTVAALAYRELKLEERAWATDLLRKHPEAAKWAAQVPGNDPNLDEGAIFFMGASKWPDELRFGNSEWRHIEWHYVDYPVTPPSFPKQPSPAPGNDIVFATNECMTMLKDPEVPVKDKACWLAWLIHIVGDITQPLHCCALVNDDFPAPQGDRGGNLIFVKAGNGNGVPLHKMWDDASGTARGFHTNLLRGYSNQAARLDLEFKREGLAELRENTIPEAWASESWQIAVDQVYLHGQLLYGRDAASAEVLPEGYTKNLKAVAERRLALGGYRLADLIREVYRSTRGNRG